MELITHKKVKERIKQIFVNSGINAVPECDDDYLKSLEAEILNVINEQEKSILAIVEKDMKRMGADLAYYMDVRRILE